MLVTVLTTGFHLMRGEYDVIGMPVILSGLAAFVAWARAKEAPITPRA